MRYSELKKRVQLVRAWGYDKYPGRGFYIKRFSREHNGTKFAIYHAIGIGELVYSDISMIGYTIRKSERNCIQALQEAILTDKKY